MKRSVFFLFLMTVVSGPVLAQYSTEGFYVRPSLTGISLSITDSDRDADDGGGAGLGFGYGFSDKWGIFLNLYGANMETANKETYSLGSSDLGARFTIGGPEKKAKFIIEAGFTGTSVEFFVGDKKVRSTGGFGTLGFSFNYFVSHSVALDIGLYGSSGKFNDVKSGGITIDTNIKATHGRGQIGLVWYP